MRKINRKNAILVIEEINAQSFFKTYLSLASKLT